MDQLISVIIPVYKRRKSVVKAILSVMEQGYGNFEIIVVDDGSPQPLDISELIKEDSRIKLVRLKKNSGPSAARNAGVRASSGAWLAWLDSDDVWAPEKLSQQMSFLERLGSERKMVALATGFEYAHPDGQLDRRIPVPSSNSRHFFAGCWFCPGSTVMLHRSLFDRVGPYDETMRRLEDLDWFIRLVLNGGRLEVAPMVMATINVGDKAPYQTVCNAGDQIIEKYKSFTPEVTKQQMSNLRAYLHLEYAASAIKRERNYLKGTYHLAVSLLSHPRLRLQLYPFWQILDNG